MRNPMPLVLSVVNALAILASFSARAAVDPVFSVVDRDEKGALTERQAKLQNLMTKDSFAGRHFIIVEADGKRAIPFSAAPETLKRAATAYYHLEKAKAYLDAQSVTTPQLAVLRSNIQYPVVIRIEMTLPYSDASHWVTDGSAAYNNSLTIAASNSNKGDDIAPWGQEIWFYQAKDEVTPSTAGQVMTLLNQRQFKNMMFQQMSYPEFVEIAQELTYGVKPFWPAHAASVGTALFVTEAIVPFLKLATKPFHSKRRIDTGMIPEVIYHEFSHLLFSKQLGLFQPRSIVEGYPNYFAYQVSGEKNIGARAKSFMKGYSVKRAKSKEQYTMAADEAGLLAATGSYMYSLLYQLSKAFGAEESDAILYGALTDLDRSSDIRIDFERAILKSISAHSKIPVAQSLRAQKVFEDKGL